MVGWSAPLPLFTCDKDNLLLNAVVTEKLEKIDKPLVIACIAGPFRMGKSYLMNRLAGKQTGFALGATVKAVTKGIWAWYVDHPKDNSKGLLLLDTEGLGDPDRGDDTYDMWILCLSILLSSVFIYNTFGKIDNSLIDTLHFVGDITGHIRAQTSDTSDTDYDGFFPDFILAIRDAYLQLKMDGVDVTEKEYMERTMLTLKYPEESEREKKRNNVKKKLRRYFPNRECFIFVRPTKEDRDLHRLEEIDVSRLQPIFIDKSNEFCQHIFNNAPVKKINRTQRVDGKIFVDLARIYLRAIHGGSVPCVSNAIELIAKRQNEMVITQCVEEYRKSMNQTLTLPATMEELESANRHCHQIVMDAYLDKMFLDEEEQYREELQKSLYNEYATFVTINNEFSTFTCNELLTEMFATVRVKINDGHYFESNGYAEFIQDVERVQREYDQTPKKGLMADNVLKTFLEQLENDQETILMAEEVLTSQDKSFERERFLRECAERQSELRKKELQRNQQHIENLMQSHENHLRRLHAIHLQKQEEERLAFKHQLEARKKEQKRLLEENFKDDADRLKEEIEDLNSKRKNFFKKVATSIASICGSILACVPHPAVAAAGIGVSIISTIVDKLSIK